MTAQEKAKVFVTFRSVSDPRCNMLIMMLALACRISESECFARIEKLAQGEAA